MLTNTEHIRYSRHLLLKGFGEAAQLKLKASKVLVIGAGGLGSPLLMYLAAAGIGTICVMDDDIVQESNLQRQVIFNTDDIDSSKATTAASKLIALNPFIDIHSYPQKLTSENALETFEKFDVIADGSDNFPTRYLVNDAAVLSNKPVVYGSVFRFEGQVSVFNYIDEEGNTGPNYRDLFPVPPPPESVPDCSVAGVLGVLPGIIGSMQALEVIKVITGVGDVLSGKLFHFDGLSMQSHTFTLKRRSDNPLNGEHTVISALIDYESFCNPGAPVKEITPEEFKVMKNKSEKFELIDVREPAEYEQMNIGGRSIPLGQVMDHASLFDKNVKIIFHCKSGSRSAKAIRQLQDKYHFTNLYNLKGGLDSSPPAKEGKAS